MTVHFHRLATAVHLKGWWASACAACNQWPSLPHGDRLCEACQQLFAPDVARCRRCALSLVHHQTECQECLGHATSLTECAAGVEYGEPWRNWIHRFKHHGEPEWASLFARILANRAHVQQTLDLGTVWLPIPMSAAALGARGYNPAWELTRCLKGGHSGRRPTIQSNWLVKTADTAPQHTLLRKERLANLRHVFALTAEGTRGVAGQDVVLVDDVMTTGATLEAAAIALLKGGAASVRAVAFARTPKPVAA